MGLRGLFGGGPKLPEPIRDAYHGEEAFRREMGQLRDAHWQPAATRLRLTRNADDRAFVISTHQVRDLGALMDPIVVLHQGRVLLAHPTYKDAGRPSWLRGVRRVAGGGKPP